MRKSTLRWIMRLVGPVLLVVVLATLRSRATVISTFAAASFWPMLAAMLLNLVQISLKTVRWQVLLRSRGIEFPFLKATGAFITSSYVGSLTPGRVGDVLRIQYLRHEHKVSYAEGLASLVMDRLCDVYVLLLFVSIGVVRFSKVIVGDLAFATWLTIGTTALLPLLLFVPQIRKIGMLRAFKKLSTGSEVGGLNTFLESVNVQLRRAMPQAVTLTLLSVLVVYFQGWLIAHALHIDLSLFDVSCLLAIASLLGLLPISVSGVGVREAFFAAVFPTLGYSAAAGVSYGLAVFALMYLFVAGLGMVCWQIYPPPVGAESGRADRIRPHLR